jgi:hypothetical protein
MIIQIKQNFGKPPTMTYLGGKGGYFEKLSWGSETSGMTSERLGEMFEGDSADMCAVKFTLMLMRPVKCAQTGSEDPHRSERKYYLKVVKRKEKEEGRRKDKMLLIVDTMFRLQRPRAVQTLGSDQVLHL